MKKYFVELDGISIITSTDTIEKGDLLLISYSDYADDYDYYKVGNVNGCNLSLKLVKYTVDTEEETKFEYALNGNQLFFDNRPSKNQLIMVMGALCQIKDIDKNTKELTVDVLKYKTSIAQYGVYESKKGLTVHDRELGDYVAERYFTERFDAIGYIMKERGKGRKISL